MKPTRYIRLRKSNFDAIGTCYQAVRIYDTIAEIAINTGNTELMFEAAEKFVDLAVRLSSSDETDEEPQEDRKFPVGFQVGALTESE